MAKQSAGKVGARSQFALRMESDPELAKRCEAVAQATRLAARDDIEAGDKSERLTKDDFAVIINARADLLFCRDE